MNHDYFYPVKIVSHSVTRRRIRRISYFGSLFFAFGCAATFSPLFTLGAWKTAGKAPAAAIATLAPSVITTAQSETPVQIDEQPAAKSVYTPVYPLALNMKVESGDTLSTILADAGVSSDEAQRVVKAVHGVYNVRHLDVGQSVAIKLDKGPGDQPMVISLNLPVSATSTLYLTRQDKGFSAKVVDSPIERKLARAGGRISNSFYETGISAGIPPALLEQIVSAYSYDVDFQRDIQRGDALDVLFEKLQTKEGANAGHGDIIFADLNLGDRDIKIYRFIDKSGHADYYNAKGENIRKALLRTPVNGARISSGFGWRLHPVLGYSRMHRGVDFAAPTGTPIYAAGDGTVEFAGRKGGYGNYLMIKHNKSYASAYGHISHFAAGIRSGQHVHQGQVIAYVGQTGIATGPHLHYEILVNGSQVNPSNVKFKTGDALQGKELVAFRTNVKKIEAQLASMPQHDGKLAMNLPQ